MSELNYDLAHLSTFSAKNLTKEQYDNEDFLLNAARESFTAFFTQLTALDHTNDNKVKLPKPVFELPREKPLPVEKPKTRWEQFVENKGLKIQKKEKKVFDKEHNEWRLRYGYKRANDPSDTWLIEVPNGVTEDPFAKLDSDKKTRVKEQQKRERRNQKRAARALNEMAVTASLKNGKKNKDEIKTAIRVATAPGSSASMNQFNKNKNKVGIFEEGSTVPKIFNRNKGQHYVRGKK